MAILVTGGAGYIGSHTVAELVAHGESVVVVDNLSLGHRQAVQRGARALADSGEIPFHMGDIRDAHALTEVFRQHEIEAVVHFAARSLVGESVQVPLDYYETNVWGTTVLVKTAVAHGVKSFVFSSSAATYGEPLRTPIQEEDPTLPTNPYGETKRAIERLLYWAHQAHGLQSISLRYFNAAGAHPDLQIGEDHHPETHLIPILLQTALGQRPGVTVFGDDYPTDDGTCIRDYVHVMDLAAAHRLALIRLRGSNGSNGSNANKLGAEVFNLGNGQGFSVQQVLTAARAVTGRAIPATVGPRRPGDPAVLVASSDRARQVLGWQPQFADLTGIVASAWRWHQGAPNGYGV
ncbi:UDP-glucose 4-epimerase GalE [Alicyclobacillaceae bacterium I2511]|nr:UDP-glucose 4-epimerase GalE [Alicyclobacillaceae bacterium I2511]